MTLFSLSYSMLLNFHWALEKGQTDSPLWAIWNLWVWPHRFETSLIDQWTNEIEIGWNNELTLDLEHKLILSIQSNHNGRLWFWVINWFNFEYCCRKLARLWFLCISAGLLLLSSEYWSGKRSGLFGAFCLLDQKITKRNFCVSD